MSLRWSLVIFALSALPACDPYDGEFNGDYYRGPIDPGCPANQPAGQPGMGQCMPFPTAYTGTIQPNQAFAKGGTVLYYPFPVADAFDPVRASAWGLPGPADITVIRTQTTDSSGNTTVKDRAPVYVFDAAPGAASGKDSTKCTAPANYTFDQQADFLPLNEQSNVFQQPQTSSEPAILPSGQNGATWGPGARQIFAEVPVTSMGESCQSIHSADGLVDSDGKTVSVSMLKDAPIGSSDFRKEGVGDGNYLAYILIDPAADVITVPDPNGMCPLAETDFTGQCHDLATHLGGQRFGYYDHFLVGYIDGGYVPTKQKMVPATMTAPAQVQTVAVAMTLYVANTYMGIDPNTGNPGPVQCGPLIGALPDDPVNGCLGKGTDLLDGLAGKDPRRSANAGGYSPICHVMSYTPGTVSNKMVNPDPTMIATDPSQIDPLQLDPDFGAYIYCPQMPGK